MDRNSLEIVNAHERDSRIEFFEQDHKYIIDGSEKTKYTSVTTIVKGFFNEFNAEEVIRKMKRSGSFGRKYGDKTEEDVREMWAATGREACRLGTILHECIENKYNGKANDYDAVNEVSTEYDLFRVFYNDTLEKLESFRMEWRVFDEYLGIAGSIDAVFRRRKDGQLVIYDWKRIKELKINNPWASAKYPISYLRDSNYHHYALQLNMYKYILEKNYNVKIAELAIVIFHHSMRNYQLVKLPFLTEEIEDMIENWRAPQKPVEPSGYISLLKPLFLNVDE